MWEFGDPPMRRLFPEAASIGVAVELNGQEH
jgi:hypothetical protein